MDGPVKPAHDEVESGEGSCARGKELGALNLGLSASSGQFRRLFLPLFRDENIGFAHGPFGASGLAPRINGEIETQTCPRQRREIGTFCHHGCNLPLQVLVGCECDREDLN